MTNNRYDGRIRPRSPFAAGNPFAEYDADEYDTYEYDDGFDDEVPRGPVPLEPRQRASLAVAIDEGLRERGCDNTLRAAEAWARREQVPWERLREELEARGGFCDCEVLFNVVPPPEE
jgi:hypothetical protein